MDDKYLRYVLNRKNELLDRDYQGHEEMICIGEWSDGSYSAVVAHNSLFSMFEEFDMIADPCPLKKIWVALKGDEGYCDTGSPPTFIKWVRQDNKAMAHSTPDDESEEPADDCPPRDHDPRSPLQ